MNWSNLLVYILYCLILTCLTGTVCTCIWKIMCVILQKNGNVELIYLLLKVTMAGYVIPILFIGKRLYYIISYHTMGYLWIATPVMVKVAGIIDAIWLIGIIVALVRYGMKYLQLRRICRSRIVELGISNSVLKECIENLRIKRKVKIYSGYTVQAPFIFGWFHPCIYLPQKDYSKEDLKNILTHELMHMKQGDIFIKPFFRVICCVLWFHPLVWLVAGQYRDWAEACCDVRCCEKYCTRQSYFTSIYDAVEFNSKNVGIFAPSWCEGENEIKWRIDIMKKDSKQKRRLGISGIVLAGVLLVSTATTYATEVGINKMYDGIVSETMEEVEEENDIDGFEELVEYSVDVSELDDAVVIDVSQMRGGSTTYASNGMINNWVVNPNVVLKSGGFNKSINSTVSVAVTATPNNKTIRVGVIQPNGVLYYVEGQGVLGHTFTVKKSGTCYIYVKNVSDTKVTVSGSYN